MRLDGRANIQQVAAADRVSAHVGFREDRVRCGVNFVGGDRLRLEQVSVAGFSVMPPE